MTSDDPLAQLDAALRARDAGAIMTASADLGAALASGGGIDAAHLSALAARVALLHRAVTHRLQTDRLLAAGGVDALA